MALRLSESVRRRSLFALLYFSEGAPIGFVWWALPTHLRSQGVDIGFVTLLTSLLALPWALKVFWAPVLDVWRSDRWTYRSWILLSQTLMGCFLIPLIFIDPTTGGALLIACLVAHAISAATQDVAIDALCISTLPPEERGRANGWMQAGMLLGRSLFGGGTLLLLSLLGPEGGVLLLVAVVWGIALVVLRSPMLLEVREETSYRPARNRSIASAIRTVLSARIVRYGLGYAFLAGAVFEGVGTVAGPFLIDSGFTTEESGALFSLPVVLAMGLGALLGGIMSDRLGARRSVFVTYGGLFVAVLCLGGATTVTSPAPTTIALLLVLVYLGIGFYTASSYTLFMAVALPEYRATSFSAYMGGTNLCESWSAFSVGKLVALLGYGPAFMVLAAVSLVSLVFLRHLRSDAGPSERNSVTPGV